MRFRNLIWFFIYQLIDGFNNIICNILYSALECPLTSSSCPCPTSCRTARLILRFLYHYNCLYIRYFLIQYVQEIRKREALFFEIFVDFFSTKVNVIIISRAIPTYLFTVVFYTCYNLFFHSVQIYYSYNHSAINCNVQLFNSSLVQYAQYRLALDISGKTCLC